MENTEVVKQIVDHIKTINFNKTAEGAEGVSLFETTIRYLGGMISGNQCPIDLISRCNSY